MYLLTNILQHKVRRKEQEGLLGAFSTVTMLGTSGCTSRVSAWILFVVNLIAMVVSILIFGFALWTIASPSSLSFTIDALGSRVLSALLSPSTLTVHLGVGLVFLTMFSFFIAFMGFYGAISRSQFLLFMYATLNLLILLLECALIYYFSSNLVEKGRRNQGDQWTHTLRLTFSCCEFSETQNVTFPWSCCGQVGYPNNCNATLVYKKDCYTTVTSWLDHYETAIYASLTVFHLVLSSCSLLRRSSSASRSLS